jgi:transcription elongation factor Elf1
VQESREAAAPLQSTQTFMPDGELDTTVKCVRCGQAGQVHVHESSLSRVFSCGSCGHHWVIPRFETAGDSEREDGTRRV